MAADELPISYEVVEKGTPVLSISGTRFGSVEHVLSDSSLDLFDGIAVRLGDRELRFVDAGQIALLTRSAVHTSITDEGALNLPAPDGDAVLEADSLEYEGDGLSAWFGRMFLREHWTRDRNWRRDE